ncbi:GIY-YIG nuclease family protein [Acetobacter sp. TBRC 12305]|uniref:GIY-YIG nuclease family protein n=1 Tax=Acetobacter garciniae TaxID=2817435 RepID=A0A939KQG6_9PROT|nr:GIY-YIG nuclease family protein [Acetobacter garciniae]MBO1325359.1 GIY-YIG nuclease family protein [Acetobacter garciniae]MBX0345469.1 GIY-YIG nuclease family protein [Acetobacter garciniae]
MAGTSCVFDVSGLEEITAHREGVAGKFFIYALTASSENEIRYIGKAKNPWKRLLQHRSLSNNRCASRHVTNWLRSLILAGDAPRMFVLEECVDWEAAEGRWIDLARKSGLRLTNLADGGNSLAHAARAKKASAYTGWTPIQKVIQNARRLERDARRLGFDDIADRSLERLARIEQSLRAAYSREGKRSATNRINKKLEERRPDLFAG